MDATQLGKQALVGWRRTVGDRAAKEIAARTSLSEDRARALIGALFFLLAARYVVGTLNKALRGAS